MTNKPREGQFQVLTCRIRPKQEIRGHKFSIAVEVSLKKKSFLFWENLIRNVLTNLCTDKL